MYSLMDMCIRRQPWSRLLNNMNVRCGKRLRRNSRSISSHFRIWYHVQHNMKWKNSCNPFIQFLNSGKLRTSSRWRFIVTSYLHRRGLRGQCMKYVRMLCKRPTKEKNIFVSFEQDNCEVVCSCYLFEFWERVYRHAITVLIRRDVTLISERYILRR